MRSHLRSRSPEGSFQGMPLSCTRRPGACPTMRTRALGHARRTGFGGFGRCASQIRQERTRASRRLKSAALTRVLRLAPSAIKAPLDAAFAAVFAAERIIPSGRTLPQATRAVAGLVQRSGSFPPPQRDRTPLAARAGRRAGDRRDQAVLEGHECRARERDRDVLRGRRRAGEGDRGRDQPRRQSDRNLAEEAACEQPGSGSRRRVRAFRLHVRGHQQSCLWADAQGRTRPRSASRARPRDRGARGARGEARGRGHARPHSRPTCLADDARQGACERGAPPTALAALDRVGVPHRKDERRGRQLQRAPRRVPELRLGAFCPGVRRIARAGIQPLHHPDRAARQPRRAVRRDRAREHGAPRPRPRSVGLRVARLFQTEGQSGGDRLLDHAAQGQSDRFRELRRQRRNRERALAPFLGKAAGIALAARPFGFDGAAEHRRRARPQPARLGVVPEGPRKDRGRSGAHARGPRGELGGARRGGADGDAPARPSRSLRAAQGVDAGQARRRGDDARIHPRPCASGRRQGAAAGADPGALHRQGVGARAQALSSSTLRRVLADFGGVYFVNAVVAFIFAASGPVAIILAVGTRGGLAPSDLSSWIFGAFFLNGLISIAFCWFYRQPLVFFWTIPGAVLVGPALVHLSFAEVIGAYIAAGLLMLALGLSGWVRRAMEAVPMPIVMGMVAGVFLRFGLDLVYAIRDDFWIAAPMVAVFLVLGASQRLAPPLIGALAVGVIAIVVIGGFEAAPQAIVLAHPNFYAPAFSWRAMVELVVPLAITVLVVQNGQGITVLRSAGHMPPVNAVTIACGAGAMVTAFVGAVSTCLTGPVNAIISSSGDRRRHYTAGIFVGLLALAFGLFAPFFTRLMLATPKACIAALAGLAMLRVLQTAFTVSFRDRFALGALVTFLVTVADIPIFTIGAPFWGLVFGYGASRLLERSDFPARG